jgi:hypothetical protein
MVCIEALGLGRGEHPQGHPIGSDSADEGAGNAVRGCMKGDKRKKKEGDQQAWTHGISLGVMHH